MKIAQVSSTFPPYEGGMGNACYNLSRQLSNLGHDVTVLLSESTEKYIPKSDEFFKVKYLKPLFSIGNACFLPKLIFELKGFDIIHLQYPFFGGDIFVRVASRKYKIPYLLSYQMDVVGDDLFKKTTFLTYNFLFQKKIMVDAIKILGLSKDHINNSKIINIKNIRNKIEVVPNGIDLERSFKNYDFNLRQRFSLPQNIPIVTFIGALDKAHYFKRVDLLLESFSKIKNPAHLLIIGGGDLEKVYKDISIKLKINKKVTFTGKLSNTLAIQYLKQTNLLVLPSSDTESFGTVLAEAMACSLPVIATNLPGVRSVVQEGINGLLFEKENMQQLTDKIEYILNNPLKALELGNNGRRIVENKYSWRKIAKNLEKIYFNCLKNNY